MRKINKNRYLWKNIIQYIDSQLRIKKYRISSALGKIVTVRKELLFNLSDPKTVVPSYNSTDTGVNLLLAKDLDSYKLYLSDIWLFVTKQTYYRKLNSYLINYQLIWDIYMKI